MTQIDPSLKKKAKYSEYEYLSDVEIYNRLMFELAKAGKTSKLYLMFRRMRSLESDVSRQIKPNLNSFAAVLHSLGYELENKINSTFDEVKLDETDTLSMKNDEKLIAKIKLSVERIIWNIESEKVFYFYLKKRIFSLD